MKPVEVCLILIILCGLAEAGTNLFTGATPARLDVIKGLMFTDKTYQSKKFSLSTYILSRQNAAGACRQMGGQLARISSEDKHDVISKWLDTLLPYDKQQIHIAGYHANNAWIYDTKTRVPYFVWHANEPSNVQRESMQDTCMVMERRNGKFKMNDIACVNVLRRFLCEKRV